MHSYYYNSKSDQTSHLNVSFVAEPGTWSQQTWAQSGSTPMAGPRHQHSVPPRPSSSQRGPGQHSQPRTPGDHRTGQALSPDSTCPSLMLTGQCRGQPVTTGKSDEPYAKLHFPAAESKIETTLPSPSAGHRCGEDSWH